MMKRSDFEIMAPVGSYDSLTAAIQGGADSVYFGIEGLNMRARSSNNFTIDDLHEIVRICNEHHIKSYLTVNTVIYDEDIPLLHRIIDAAKEAGLSAIIASDVAAMTYAREIGVEVHLSTQLNISNTEALRFYARFADVVVLAQVSAWGVGKIFQLFPGKCFFKVKNGALQKSFNTVYHAINMSDFFLFYALRNYTIKAAVDNCSRSAGLSDDQVLFFHFNETSCCS